jgi:hypothetical protein
VSGVRPPRLNRSVSQTQMMWTWDRSRGSLSTATLLAVLTACATARGAAQLAVRHDPFLFVDEPSGQPVGEVLVVPRYSSFAGVSSGGGHGPGAGHDRVYLAAPFVYRSDERFVPSQPNSAGLVAGGLFIGKGVSLDGVLIITAGYRARWLWSLWDRGVDRKVALTPLNRHDGARQLRQVSDLLHKQVLSGAERELWSLGGNAPIEVRFTPEQMTMVDDFVSRGLSLLGATESRDAG